MNAWNKSQDKMPEDTRTVLVFCPSPGGVGEIFDAQFEDGEWWGQSGPVAELGEVTHWCELPPKPAKAE